MKMNSRDINNQRFGRLVAIKITKNSHYKRGIVWLCRCDCGNLVYVLGYNLKNGTTHSCGCLQIECAKKTGREASGYKHGGVYTRLYRIWAGMKRRCLGKTSTRYRYYGKQGIQIYSAWKTDFSNFRNWAMANGYANNLTIDRINHNGNYEPSNCQWLTRSENTKKQHRDKKNENLFRDKED